MWVAWTSRGDRAKVDARNRSQTMHARIALALFLVLLVALFVWPIEQPENAMTMLRSDHGP